jgi:LAO/AO transport system kinase
VTPEEVIEGVRAGKRRAIGRAISMTEQPGADGRAVLAALHPHTGRAIRVGLTGPPGAGKSTLTAALVRHLRAAGTTVAIVSVDPSSPFTDGAVLGDRIRLVDHFLDDGVFIRSMATRGHLGGLSEATGHAVEILDAAGFDVVIVETVGAGQNEVEVQALAETVVLVLIPGSGDAIQAIKAGVMEIPDVIVINKADRPGAGVLASEIDQALTLVPIDGWKPPVLLTQAIDGDGVVELWGAINDHRAALAEGDALDARRRDGMRRRLRVLALERMARDLDAAIDDAALDALAARVVAREVDPSAAADTMTAATRKEADGE